MQDFLLWHRSRVYDYSWEEAVEWLRSQPDQQDLVHACYFDESVYVAAMRFYQSNEWDSVRDFLPSRPGKVLDLGAGRGISSFAFFQDGWQVTAIEPDTSSIVGTNAIEELNTKHDQNIEVIQAYGEFLPLPTNHFDIVYGRQVLHHSQNLSRLCQEVSRVLKTGGRLVATREHVINNQRDLDHFLKVHPLHHKYGGEHAYAIGEYKAAIANAGLNLFEVLGPYDSSINYYPLSKYDLVLMCRSKISQVFGSRIAEKIIDQRQPIGKSVIRLMTSVASKMSRTPGRLFSFIASK